MLVEAFGIRAIHQAISGKVTGCRMAKYWNLIMILKYYLDVTIFNLCFSIIVGTISPFGGFMTFGTIGNLIGIFCYNMFYHEQYYFYFNRGLNKKRLYTALFKVNSPVAIPIALLIYFAS